MYLTTLFVQPMTSIFITGSNSKLRSGELATHLSGRTVSFRIMSFNFAEFYEFCQLNDSKQTDDELIAEYMTWGGFPLICKETDDYNKDIVVSNIYDSVVLKDIILRNKIASPNALERVLEYIMANSSTTISGNTIAAKLEKGKYKISAPTVYDYIRFISEACICDNELISRGYKVYIGKTYKGEVDFIAEKSNVKIYIQAAYMMSDDHVIEREFGAYDAIKDHFPKYVISLDKHTMSRDGIIHMNLIEWLLEEK